MVQLLAAMIALGAVTVWIATGREGYTRWPNAKLTASGARLTPEELALLEDIGVQGAGASEAPGDIESRFSLGLLPGGFDPKHMVSVLTLLLVAGGLSAASLLAWRRGRRREASCPSDPVHGAHRT